MLNAACGRSKPSRPACASELGRRHECSHPEEQRRATNQALTGSAGRDGSRAARRSPDPKASSEMTNLSMQRVGAHGLAPAPSELH